jgi:hypothetical protein
MALCGLDTPGIVSNSNPNFANQLPAIASGASLGFRTIAEAENTIKPSIINQTGKSNLMLNTKLQLTVGLAVLAAATVLAQTQTNTPAGTTSPTAPAAQAATATAAPVAAAPAATPATAFEQWEKAVKNPVGWFSWGGDLRVRNEYFNNALSLTANPNQSPLFAPVHSQDYFRYRGRLWASLFPTNNLTLNVGLAAEPREFMEPSTMDTYYGHAGVQWRYGIVDTLNVQWKNPLNLPAVVTVGRQNIFLGDGWLVGDGTPEDGSFTTFLDSARITYTLKDQHTTIDAIGIIQCARPDAWLPTIGDSGTVAGDPEGLLLTDQNETGCILWIANKSLEAANLDAYFIYKNDTRLNDPPPASFGDNANIYTVGGRVSGLLKEHWKYSAEGAYQFGEKQDPELNQGGNNPVLAPGAQTTGYRNLNAFGVQSKVTYLFKDQLKDQLSLSFEFLSGDDPNSKNDEMFDVLWGRWPQWSEMYNVYSYVQETRVGQTANLLRIGPTWSLDPIKDMNFSLSYYALFADQDTPTRPLNQAFGMPAIVTPFSNDGNYRGDYLQAVLKYRFTKNLTGHLWSEFLFPGDFYASRDMMTFLRAELMFTF